MPPDPSLLGRTCTHPVTTTLAEGTARRSCVLPATARCRGFVGDANHPCSELLCDTHTRLRARMGETISVDGRERVLPADLQLILPGDFPTRRWRVIGMVPFCPDCATRLREAA